MLNYVFSYFAQYPNVYNKQNVYIRNSQNSKPSDIHFWVVYIVTTTNRPLLSDTSDTDADIHYRIYNDMHADLQH